MSRFYNRQDICRSLTSSVVIPSFSGKSDSQPHFGARFPALSEYGSFPSKILKHVRSGARWD